MASKLLGPNWDIKQLCWKRRAEDNLSAHHKRLKDQRPHEDTAHAQTRCRLLAWCAEREQRPPVERWRHNWTSENSALRFLTQWEIYFRIVFEIVFITKTPHNVLREFRNEDHIFSLIYPLLFDEWMDNIISFMGLWCVWQLSFFHAVNISFNKCDSFFIPPTLECNHFFCTDTIATPAWFVRSQQVFPIWLMSADISAFCTQNVTGPRERDAFPLLCVYRRQSVDWKTPPLFFFTNRGMFIRSFSSRCSILFLFPTGWSNTWEKWTVRTSFLII